jgi:hypothetical protein
LPLAVVPVLPDDDAGDELAVGEAKDGDNPDDDGADSGGWVVTAAGLAPGT